MSRHHLPLLSCLAPTLLCAAAAGQTWSLVATTTNPGALRDAAAAFHVPTGQTVLFGG